MTPEQRSEDASPDDLRALGWAVAIHNDYRQNGEPHTFWLFTKGERNVKGEGRTDMEALNEVRATLNGIDAVNKDAARWQALAGKIAVMLDHLEWVYDDARGAAYCPVCRVQADTIGGHDFGCTLDALLSEAATRSAMAVGYAALDALAVTQNKAAE